MLGFGRYVVDVCSLLIYVFGRNSRDCLQVCLASQRYCLSCDWIVVG